MDAWKRYRLYERYYNYLQTLDQVRLQIRSTSTTYTNFQIFGIANGFDPTNKIIYVDGSVDAYNSMLAQVNSFPINVRHIKMICTPVSQFANQIKYKRQTMFGAQDIYRWLPLNYVSAANYNRSVVEIPIPAGQEVILGGGENVLELNVNRNVTMDFIFYSEQIHSDFFIRNAEKLYQNKNFYK